jgi:hypothetical protein
MFSALTITSVKQSMAYDEATAVAAFSKIEGLVALVTKLLLAVQSSHVAFTQRGQSVRMVREFGGVGSTQQSWSMRTGVSGRF